MASCVPQAEHWAGRMYQILPLQFSNAISCVTSFIAFRYSRYVAWRTPFNKVILVEKTKILLHVFSSFFFILLYNDDSKSYINAKNYSRWQWTTDRDDCKTIKVLEMILNSLCQIIERQCDNMNIAIASQSTQRYWRKSVLVPFDANLLSNLDRGKQKMIRTCTSR